MSGSTLLDRAVAVPAADLRHSQVLAEAAAGLFGVDTAIQVGRYELVRLLGSGGMGEVFLAHDRQLQRSVALKVLHPWLHEASPEASERSLREALALARVNHANVVEVFEVGEHEGRPFVAMEYIEGQTLQAWLDEDQPSWRDIVEVYVAAGRGVLAAHRAGLVHRDFKPDNVLISGRGRERRVRVLDFGIARLAGVDMERTHDSHASQDSESELTREGTLLGTPAYMAPEQLRGELATEASDQFSFCLALHRALWKVDPFVTTNVVDRLASMESHGPRPPPSEGLRLQARTPRALWPILRRGLALEPSARWPDLEAVLDALERAIHRRRRRWVGGGVALALGLSLALGFDLGSTPGDELDTEASRAAERARLIAACEDEASVLEREWSAASPRLAASFAATTDPGAAESWAIAEARLDELVDDWARVRAEACVAGELEGTRSAESLTRIRSCLDERAQSLRVHVDVLIDLDHLDLSYALESLFELVPPESCLDVHSVRPPPPAGADIEEIQALRARVERVHALRELARFDEAEAEAEILRTAAERVAWAPLEAETLHALGRLSFARGQYEAAEASLVDAYEAALAHGYDELALRCAIELGWTVGVGSRHFEDGRLWLRHAGALLARQQLEGSIHDAALTMIAGMLATDYDLRLEQTARAEQLWQATLGAEHPRVAEALKYHSRALVELDRVAEGMVLLTRALDIQERTLGPHHPHVARTLIHLAEAERERGDYDAAERALERALAIQRQAFGDEHEEILETLMARVRVLHSRGQLDEAIVVTSEILRRHAVLSGADSLVCAKTLASLATLEAERGHTTEALAHLERAERIYAKHRSASTPGVVWQRAKLHGRRGEVETAKALFQQLLDDEPDFNLFVRILDELVRLPLDAGELRSLRPLLEQALEPRALSPEQQRSMAIARGGAALRFALARSLGPGSPRARTLAEAARDHLRLDPPSDPELLAEIEAWLARVD